jgi:NitT/TauT family transport system substrate-binding protein
VGRLRTNLAFAAGAVTALLLSVAVLNGYIATAPPANALRLGFFPNVTHAQALFGIATGLYQQALGNFTVQPRVYGAGPNAISALLTNQVDVIFVGPSPTLTGLAVAGTDVVRVIAGAASRGEAFVIQPYVHLTTNGDLTGKHFATPQWGNSQDIALKHFLLVRGHTTQDRGGDVDIITPGNAGILSQFQLHRIDGAWVPEPWATRLVVEAGGVVCYPALTGPSPCLDHSTLWPNGQFVTTHLVTTKRYLDGHRDILTKFLNAYLNVTLRLERADPADLTIVNGEITNLTNVRLSQSIVDAAFPNLNLTVDPIATSLATYLAWAQELGFVPSGVDAKSLYDLTLLNQILVGRGLPPVTGL